MLLFFQICFFVGVGLTTVSFLFGHLLHIPGFDGTDFFQIDLGGADGSADAGGWFPISPLLIVIFLTIFGGSGIIMFQSGNFSALQSTAASGGIGILICTVLQFGVFLPLKNAENTSAPEADELIGHVAKVTEIIPENGFGEISYVINGNSFLSPAKSVDNKEIKAGIEVSICWIKEHIFYVTPLTK